MQKFSTWFIDNESTHLLEIREQAINFFKGKAITPEVSQLFYLDTWTTPLLITLSQKHPDQVVQKEYYYTPTQAAAIWATVHNKGLSEGELLDLARFVYYHLDRILYRKMVSPSLYPLFSLKYIYERFYNENHFLYGNLDDTLLHLYHYYRTGDVANLKPYISSNGTIFVHVLLAMLEETDPDFVHWIRTSCPYKIKRQKEPWWSPSPIQITPELLTEGWESKFDINSFNSSIHEGSKISISSIILIKAVCQLQKETKTTGNPVVTFKNFYFALAEQIEKTTAEDIIDVITTYNTSLMTPKRLEYIADRGTLPATGDIQKWEQLNNPKDFAILFASIDDIQVMINILRAFVANRDKGGFLRALTKTHSLHYPQKFLDLFAEILEDYDDLAMHLSEYIPIFKFTCSLTKSITAKEASELLRILQLAVEKKRYMAAYKILKNISDNLPNFMKALMFYTGNQRAVDYFDEALANIETHLNIQISKDTLLEKKIKIIVRYLESMLNDRDIHNEDIVL